MGKPPGKAAASEAGGALLCIAARPAAAMSICTVLGTSRKCVTLWQEPLQQKWASLRTEVQLLRLASELLPALPQSVTS